MTNAAATNNDVAYWKGEIERAKKRYRTFWDNGDRVVDDYRLQKADGNDAVSKDKYNILYSSTETIRPNLYAQAPKVRVVLRNKDTANDIARMAAKLEEGCLEYVKQEEDFDDLMNQVVEDFLLPGLGTGWVDYKANFEDKKDPEGKPLYKEDGKTPQQSLLDEMVCMDYVYWQDMLFGVARGWKTVPWIARRLWLDKDAATKRFGADKANQLSYATRENSNRDDNNPSETAEAWEIWDKRTRKVFWYGEGCADLLDDKPDPLKLKDFFPCPRPLRAISNTRTFVPRALYSQYKSQAETLNVLTKRIRLLGEALRVVGFFDGTNAKLADVLNPNAGNRMIAVDSWAQFAQQGAFKGSVDWVPIDTVVKTLNELLSAREVCKQEIYEITGFSDIVRGVSKASETLGAQNLKANWAGARVKKLQAEVQRFARDMLALAGELIAEHCSPETIALFSGVSIPDPQQVQQDQNLQKQVMTFKAACDLLKSELRRVSVIDIETDSTLMADEEAERKDRTDFLAAAGAFLQQAVPAMEATPELGPLLGAMLMFVVRTFPTSRPIEDEFEKVQEAMVGRQQNQDQDKDGKKAKVQADAQAAQAENALKTQELEVRKNKEMAEAQQKQIEENNRHNERMEELALKNREVAIKERELALKENEVEIAEEDARTRKFTAISTAAIGAAGIEAEVQANEQQQELEFDAMDREDEHRDADREVAREAAQAAQEAPEGGSEGGDA